jgi:uncharacterized membrane protein
MQATPVMSFGLIALAALGLLVAMGVVIVIVVVAASSGRQRRRDE